MKQITSFTIFFLIAGFAFVSCKKDKTIQQETKRPPVANAGVDQTIILPIDSTELSGSGTDADGTIVSYEWTKISGPAQHTLVNSAAVFTKVKSLVEGAYVFELKVTDNDRLSTKDKVVVIVRDSANISCYGCWDY